MPPRSFVSYLVASLDSLTYADQAVRHALRPAYGGTQESTVLFHLVIRLSLIRLCHDYARGPGSCILLTMSFVCVGVAATLARTLGLRSVAHCRL